MSRICCILKEVNMNQEKLYGAMQDDLFNRDSAALLYRIAEHWTLVTTKYHAYVMPADMVDGDLAGNKWSEDSHVHHRIDNTLNGSDLVCIGHMTVNVNMLRQKVLVMRDDFGIVYFIRWTKTAEMLSKDKKIRCKRYQDLVCWWSADDDFPIYAACEINPHQARGIAK